jgi:hypothetical protein
MTSGSFSTVMDSRSAIRIGWWMFWQGVWGLITRKPRVSIEHSWTS